MKSAVKSAAPAAHATLAGIAEAVTAAAKVAPAAAAATVVGAAIAVAILTAAVAWADCPFKVQSVDQITRAGGRSQTGRANQRCIWADPAGRVHLVWEDERDGNFEIYYKSIGTGEGSPETRITETRAESIFPCITGQSDTVYVLWQETVAKTPQLMYLRMVGGKEIVRKQITQSITGAYSPVVTLGPDKALHIVFHQGAGNATSVHYGKIVGDSLVARTEICAKHLGAFRPDIACDANGRMLVVWYEGAEVKSRLWDGTAWQEELLVASTAQTAWRLSVSNMSPGRWVAAWFDQGTKTTDVLAAFFDGTSWQAKTRLNTGQIGFYPTTACFGPDKVIVAWEDQDKHADSVEYLLMMRCHDGKTWGAPSEIARGPSMSRYASLAPAGQTIHAIWFSPLMGNSEIFHATLVSK